MRRAMIGTISLIIVVAASGGRLHAQEAIKDPGAIAQCLCARETLHTLFDAVQERRHNYESSRASLASLNDELATRRSRMNIYDDQQIDAYKALLQRRDNAAASFAGDVTEKYRAAVARYQAAYSKYNADCAGKSFDQAAYDKVKAALSCPKD